MRTSTLPLYGLLVPVLLSISASGVARADDLKAGVTAADARWATAFASHDAHAVAAIYTADGQILAGGSDPVSGPAALAKFIQSVLDEGVAAVELTTVEVYGQGRMATDVGRYVMKDKAGKEIDHGKFMEVWRLEKGVWKLHRDMFNSSVAPAK